MDKKDVDRLVACRALIDWHMGSYAESEDSFYQMQDRITEGLKAHGFSGIHEFDAFNSNANLEEFLRCMKLRGECDYCGEETLSTQICVQKFGLTACTMRPKGGGVDMGAIVFTLRAIQRGEFVIREGKRVHSNHCKWGHGYYLNVDEDKPQDFDFCWMLNRNIPENANWTKKDFEENAMTKPEIKRSK